MKKYITFLILIISLNLFGQEVITIKGKLFFSQDFYNTFHNLLVKIDDDISVVKIAENGEFEIRTSIKEDYYKLLFYFSDIKFKEFNYKYEWTQRKRPKSISLVEKCEVNKFVAQNDFMEKRMRLFYYNRGDNEFSKKDKRFQKRNKIEYIKVLNTDLNNYDCYMDYNKRIFLILSLRGRNKITDLRKDVIGYNYRYNR